MWTSTVLDFDAVRMKRIAGRHGRGERIRTSDLTVPNRARYQAAPRPEYIELR